MSADGVRPGRWPPPDAPDQAGRRARLRLAQGGAGVKAIDESNEHLVLWGRVRLDACRHLRREHREVGTLPQPEALEMLVRLFRDRVGSPDQGEAHVISRCYVQRFPKADDKYSRYVKTFSDSYEQAGWHFRLRRHITTR